MNGTVANHGCRPEPHCLCGENAWYHRDVDEDGMQGAAECGMSGCTCHAYRRCHVTWVLNAAQISERYDVSQRTARRWLRIRMEMP
jgi:hypothetical protein